MLIPIDHDSRYATSYCYAWKSTAAVTNSLDGLLGTIFEPVSLDPQLVLRLLDGAKKMAVGYLRTQALQAVSGCVVSILQSPISLVTELAY